MILPNAGILLPPTRFALKARPWFMVLLALQALLMLGRFVILDIWGALLSLLIITMGSFVLSTGIGFDTGYCLYFGLMCLVNGVFDAVLFIERAVHVKHPLLARSNPMVFNAASAIFILCPMVEMASASLAAAIFIDASEQESQLLNRNSAGGMAMENEGRHGNDTPQFQAFTGRACHL
eukprot:TRINITY_DN5621_c0_g1_i1.p1 TRINITY_DN5621_c0_g1~~TRINITY_DN5621_c0_g1_i1.p1  ORF type:complete len:179 (-),score=26.06 TRINITY_DN5621_c0_g1_i1:208-744(-)